MGVNPSNIYVGFNAIDVSRFHLESSQRRETTAQVAEIGHRFIYVGQLIPRKNLTAMMEAFARMREPSDQLTILGSGESESELKALGASLKILPQLTFLGDLPNSEIPALLASQDTLILVSIEEVWGLVINEALASGIHVVVSDVSGVAASVARMTGVFICGIQPDAIEGAMRRSKEGWKGPIFNPEILTHTPVAFAEVFAIALHVEQGSTATKAESKLG
ncbi:glycosyltransferase involved in cell wall biosynthesis [Cryobacterium psychrotolerans]|nr:glycosyltransferase involved in cell wall biosynthesis [Cryobacterium psychrotolerans]